MPSLSSFQPCPYRRLVRLTRSRPLRFYHLIPIAEFLSHHAQGKIRIWRIGNLGSASLLMPATLSHLRHRPHAWLSFHAIRPVLGMLLPLVSSPTSSRFLVPCHYKYLCPPFTPFVDIVLSFFISLWSWYIRGTCPTSCLSFAALPSLLFPISTHLGPPKPYPPSSKPSHPSSFVGLRHSV